MFCLRSLFTCLHWAPSARRRGVRSRRLLRVYCVFLLLLLNFPLLALGRNWEAGLSDELVDQAFSTDVDQALEAWQNISLQLEVAHEKAPKDPEVIRNLIAAYSQVLALGDTSELSRNICTLIPAKIALLEEVAGTLNKEQKTTVGKAKLVIYFKMGLYPLALEQCESMKADVDCNALKRAMEEMGQAKFKAGEVLHLKGEMLDYQLAVIQCEDASPEDGAMSYRSYFIPRPIGLPEAIPRLWYGLAEQQIDESSSFYLYGHVGTTPTLLHMYGSKQPSDTELQDFISRHFGSALMVPKGLELQAKVDLVKWLKWALVALAVVLFLVLLSRKKNKNAKFAALLLLCLFSAAIRQGETNGNVKPDPRMAALLAVYEDIKQGLEESEISLHGEKEKETPEDPSVNDGSDNSRSTDGVPLDKSFPDPPEGSKGHQVGIPVKSSPEAVKVHQHMEYVVSKEMMKRIVRGDLQTVNQVRRHLAQAVVAGKLDEKLGREISASAERLAQGAKFLKQNRNKLRIDSGRALLQLRHAAKESKRAASAPNAEMAKAVSKEAFGYYNSEGGKSRPNSAKALPSFAPPSMYTPVLQKGRRNTLQIKAPPPPLGGKPFVPKGVKIQIDDVMLAQVLANKPSMDQLRELDDLEKKVLAAKDGVQVFEILQAYTEGKKTEFVEKIKKRKRIGDVRQLSLQTLYKKLEPYREKWDTRPAELQSLGGLTRIYGFMYEPLHQDLLLLGVADPDTPPIRLDDFTIALETVWKREITPGCSLDATPGDVAGPQKSRVIGVPKNSSFAKIMLDADYEMKQILFAAPGFRLDIPGFDPLKYIFMKNKAHTESVSRFWLYPVQPNANDIQLGPGGSSAFFDAKVMVKTEAMAGCDRAAIGHGNTVPEDRLKAEAFSRHYNDIAARQPIFRQLQGLFDLVVMCKVLKQVAPSDDLLDALAQHPLTAVKVPHSYKGIRVEHIRGNRKMTISGGCSVKARAQNYNLIEAHSEDLGHLGRMQAPKDQAQSLWKDLEGITLNIPYSDEESVGIDAQAFRAGQNFMASRDWEKALAEFTRAIQANPQLAQAYALRGKVRLKLKDQEKAALWDVGKAVQLDPQDPSLRVLMRLLVEDLGLDNWLDKLPDASVEQLAIEFWLNGVSDLSNGEFESAIRAFDRAEKYDSSLAFIYVDRAAAHFQQQSFDKVLEDCERALEINPRLVPAMTNQGLAYHRLGENLKAIECFTKVLVYDPKNARALGGRAGVKKDLEDREGAEKDAMAALENNPLSTGALMVNGVLTMQNGNFDKAIELFTRIIDLCEEVPYDYQYPRAYTNRGYTKSLKGDQAGAMDDYNKALQIDPKHTNALYNRANIYVRLKQPAKALEGFKATLDTNPTIKRVRIQSHANSAVAQMQLAEQDATNAKTLLEAAMKDAQAALELCDENSKLKAGVSRIVDILKQRMR